METKKADNKKEYVTEFDPSKLRIDIKLTPIARYPDKTWGGKIESIIINGLPDEAFFNRFTPDIENVAPGTLAHPQTFLTIENGKATLIQTKVVPINKNLNEGCNGCEDLGVSCRGYRKEHEAEKKDMPCHSSKRQK